MDQSFFDADYYLNGPKTGKSNYENYRWMPELTGELAETLMSSFGLDEGSDFLDYGCARGYLVRALRERGVRADGFDTSEWAISNCDPNVRKNVFNSFEHLGPWYDFALAKDVFEHVPWATLEQVIPDLMVKCGRLLIVVPVTYTEEGEFLYPADNQDASHINRHTSTGWLTRLSAIWPRTFVCFAGHHATGIIKPASRTHPGSTAFFILENRG